MEHVHFAVFLCVISLSLSSSEYTADTVYDILSSKMDNVHFDIRNLRSDINEISEKAGQTRDVECTEAKQLFETYKTEMDGKFSSLEEKITKKVDIYVQEIMAAVTEKINDKFEQADIKREKQNSEIKRYVLGVRKTLSSEKQFMRNVNNEFEELVTNKLEKAEHTIQNRTSEFELKIEDEKQMMADKTSTFERRIEEVEQKMFAFENSSWKGDRGEIGPSGPQGPKGIKGSKGERGIGLKGQKGERGYMGSKGFKGQKGSPESRKSVFFSVSIISDQSLPQNATIKFDFILQNNGGGYNSATGKFTAPHSGVYLFLFFVEAGKEQYNLAYVNLYVKGLFKAYAIQESRHAGHDTGGGNAYVCFMSAGDQAWIQTGELSRASTYLNMANYGTTFTGILIN